MAQSQSIRADLLSPFFLPKFTGIRQSSTTRPYQQSSRVGSANFARVTDTSGLFDD
jgi:hypothetical protein